MYRMYTAQLASGVFIIYIICICIGSTRPGSRRVYVCVRARVNARRACACVTRACCCCIRVNHTRHTT